MRNEIWRSMLDADMNTRYWKAIVRKYSMRDKYWRIFLAVMASGTVASWGIWETLPALWKSLSAVSAIAAIALPTLDYPSTIAVSSSLAGKWGELRIEYEELWRKVESENESATLQIAFAKYKNIQSTLEDRESGLPKDSDLLDQAFDSVKRSRGI